MRTFLALTLLLATPALAGDTSVPLRPLTYPTDTKLSAAPVANFRMLYVDPAVLAAGMKPATGAEGDGTLLVTNDREAQAEIAINDVKVGVIGPMTIGAIGPIKGGTYHVRFTWQNGFSEVVDIATSAAAAPGAYGGPAEAPPKAP